MLKFQLEYPGEDHAPPDVSLLEMFRQFQCEDEAKFRELDVLLAKASLANLNDH